MSMAAVMPMASPSPVQLLKTINACIENGDRLLEEYYDLEFRNPPSSRFYLVMIAQEEFAKAFILFLIKESILHLTPSVLRAINDHVCKQLVGMIMDYMILHWEDIDELKAEIDRDFDAGDQMPNDVGSAMEIFCYEKIGRWEANNWVWDEAPKYDASAQRIAKGKIDSHKQDALYVRVGGDGQIRSTPKIITEDETKSALERANRFKRFMESVLVDKDTCSPRYVKAMNALRILFAQKQGCAPLHPK